MPVPVPMPKSVAPTDNLYKFAALFGLALIIAASVLLGVQNERYNEKVVTNYIEEVVSASTSQPSPTAAASRESMDRVKDHAELAAQKALLTVETKDYQVMLCIGTAVSMFGFYFWYRKLQRHQDTLLEAQVKKELAILEKPSAEDSALEESAVAEGED